MSHLIRLGGQKPNNNHDEICLTHWSLESKQTANSHHNAHCRIAKKGSYDPANNSQALEDRIEAWAYENNHATNGLIKVFIPQQKLIKEINSQNNQSLSDPSNNNISGFYPANQLMNANPQLIHTTPFSFNSYPNLNLPAFENNVLRFPQFNEYQPLKSDLMPSFCQTQTPPKTISKPYSDPSRTLSHPNSQTLTASFINESENNTTSSQTIQGSVAQKCKIFILKINYIISFSKKGTNW